MRLWARSLMVAGLLAEDQHDSAPNIASAEMLLGIRPAKAALPNEARC
jgi:hypothetical protein